MLTALPSHAGGDSVRDEVDAFISSLGGEDPKNLPGIAHARSRRGSYSRSQDEATSVLAHHRVAGNPLSLTITIPTSPTMMAAGAHHPALGAGGLALKAGRVATTSDGDFGGGGGASASRYTTRLKTGTVAPVPHYGNLGAGSSDGFGSDDGDSDTDAVPSPAARGRPSQHPFASQHDFSPGGPRKGIRSGGSARVAPRKRRATTAGRGCQGGGTAAGDAAQEAEMKKAKSVQSARDCRRRKKAFIQSLQVQVKRCEDREASSQQLIATLEKKLVGLKTAAIAATPGLHQPYPPTFPVRPSASTPGVAGHRPCTYRTKSAAGARARANPNKAKIPLFLQRGGTSQILG